MSPYFTPPKAEPEESTVTAPFHIETHVAGAMANPHWHDHVEINLLLSGRMTYQFNGVSTAVDQGRASMFWAAIPHQTVTVEPGSELVCIYFPLAEFAALPIGDMRGIVTEGGFVTSRETDQADAILFPRWAREWRGDDPLRQALLKDEIRQRIRRAALDPHDTVRMGDVPSAQQDRDGMANRHGHRAIERAQQMVDLINHRFAEPLTVASIAAELGVHPTTAMASFRDVIGQSLHAYLLRRRLDRAKALLAETAMPIITISFECGFGSLGRFYSLFKEAEGITPRAFRQGGHGRVAGLSPRSAT